MSTTNKAFIDAYNQSNRRRPVKPVPMGELAEELLGTSEMVSATATEGDLSVFTGPRVDQAEPTARRPLSAVQADELFRFDPPAASRCQPQWPLMCQMLLAQAADRYDAVLRKLPTERTGMLVGVVGAAPQSGCTTTAICLALRSAALGFDTLLVDGNLAASGLAGALEVDSYLSWGGLLESNTSIASAIVSADDDGVDLLLTEPLEQQRLESTHRFRASLAAGLLRRKYQRVIVDLGCPTMGEGHLVADLTAAMGIDFLLATGTPATTSEQLTATTTALDRFGLQVAGVIDAV